MRKTPSSSPIKTQWSQAVIKSSTILRCPKVCLLICHFICGYLHLLLCHLVMERQLWQIILCWVFKRDLGCFAVKEHNSFPFSLHSPCLQRWEAEKVWCLCEAANLGMPCEQCCIIGFDFKGLHPWCNLNWIFTVAAQLKIKAKGCPPSLLLSVITGRKWMGFLGGKNRSWFIWAQVCNFSQRDGEICTFGAGKKCPFPFFLLFKGENLLFHLQQDLVLWENVHTLLQYSRTS